MVLRLEARTAALELHREGDGRCRLALHVDGAVHDLGVEEEARVVAGLLRALTHKVPPRLAAGVSGVSVMWALTLPGRDVHIYAEDGGSDRLVFVRFGGKAARLDLSTEERRRWAEQLQGLVASEPSD